MDTFGVSENALFMPGRTDPPIQRMLAFSGTSVTLGGEQRYLDSHLSYHGPAARHRLPAEVRLTATSRPT